MVINKNIIVAHVMTNSRSMRFLYDHIEWLRTNNIDYHVLANFKEDEAKEKTVNYRGPKKDPYIHQVGFSRKFFALSDVFSLFSLTLNLKKINAETIIVSTPKAALFAGLVTFLFFNSTHRILLVRGFRHTTMRGIKGWLVKKMELLPIFLYQDVLVTSKETLKVLNENLPLFTHKKMSVVLNGTGNGINTDKFSEGNRGFVRKRLGITKKEVVLLYVGRVCKDKGMDELLQAYDICLEKNYHVRLLIVGLDDYTDPLTEVTLSRLNKVAIRVGFVDNEEIVDFYKAADILVFPSHREGFGVVAIEAAASGLPTIASNIGGLKSAVREGVSGVFFQPLNANDLAEKIMMLISNKSYYNQLKSRAREFAVKNFDINIYNNYWLNIYKKNNDVRCKEKKWQS